MLRNTGTRLKSPVAWPSITSTHERSVPISHKSSSSHSEEEKYTAAPTHSQSFGDALAAALEQTKLSGKYYTLITIR